ncbi:MAG: ABC transporter permease [Pseudomonadota bacterium]|nr:ABC transporter permease [Pseudomonadota bacterium]
MWRNYVTVGVRALIKNRTYAFINIFGLALGLAACLLLLLYVRYEMSYDRWLPDSERIYQVQAVSTDPEEPQPQPMRAVHRPVGPSLAREFPQIESFSRLEYDSPVFMRDGEATAVDNMRIADEPFFEIIQLPFLRGDPATALSGLDSLVLSRSEAMRLFGTIDVLGRTITAIRRGEQSELRVTGVFEDIPRNSHTNFGIVGRINPADEEACGWTCISGQTYVKLRPGASAEDIHRGLAAWERRAIPTRQVGDATVSEGDIFDWRLVNVGDVHLSDAPGDLERPGNDRRTIVTFSIIALLILFMAAVNFVNLATARAGQRAREVALRKVLGARRRQLITQFLAESVLITTVAMVVALALVELSLPALSAFLGSDLEMSYFGSGGVLLPILLLLAVVGLAGGLYPAFYLSRYKPATVLKANKSAAEPIGSGRLRSMLVIAQFAVSIGLIICTAVVYAQTVFAQTSDPGYRRQGLLQIDNMTRAAVIDRQEAVAREIARVDGVTGVAGTNITVATRQTLNTEVQVPGRSQSVMIGWYSVHPDFFEVLGLRLLAGRPLSRDYAQDYAWTPYQPEEAIAPAQRAMAQRGINIVVNELAAQRLGLGDPQQALGKQVRINAYGDEADMLPARIVGVVGNSRFRSIREPLEPMIYYDRGIYQALVVRYDSVDPQAVRANIEQLWRRLAPEVPFEAEFAEAEMAELYRSEQARSQTFAAFALLAVVIACLGLFGLAAFTAERRTKEIGIRKVFGARSRDIVRLLAWQFSKPVIVANLIAWPVAWWVMRDWLNGFDARIDLGPGPFLLAGALALAIALGTIAGHAFKVSRANPIRALRYE